jgi:hypothetical protein
MSDEKQEAKGTGEVKNVGFNFLRPGFTFRQLSWSN